MPTATFSQPAWMSSLLDRRALVARSHDGRLIEQVRELRTREAVCLARDQVQIHVGAERLVARVNVEDRATAGDVRQTDVDLAREAAGSQQRLVENVDAVRRGDDDDVSRRS